MELSTALAVLPALRARVMPNGRVGLTRKFVEGMRVYLELWDGPVSVYMEPKHDAGSDLDGIEYNPSDLPFKFQAISFDHSTLGHLLRGHRLVLGSVSYRQNDLASLCRSIGVPCVYVAEYSLKTRCQVVRSEVRNPVIALRRVWWEYTQERRHRAAIEIASGIQCNGTPTYDAYRSMNSHPLLYFDTRISEDLLINQEEMAERVAAVQRGEPLRLLFSGRFVAMKGADHLVRVAAELRRLGVPFLMKICGGGTLEPRMRADIERLGLGDHVKLEGVLDFETKLVPLTKNWADLFVCCHRTGDPSCTYLEVMSGGVPIVGYDNEAFHGVVRESRAGWLTPINQPERLAEKIAQLDKSRIELVEASQRAAEFARRHTFERTFRARIEHIKACAVPMAAHAGVE
jgi:glycosyltransferase involved in cell wall biosynthesis